MDESIYTYHEMATVDADGRLWTIVHANELITSVHIIAVYLEVYWPDAVVLGDGQRLQRGIEQATRFCYQLLG